VGEAAQPIWVRGGITLGQFLKLAGVAESGGHAKELIRDGEVTVNDQEDRRRGRKLVPGDLVQVGSVTLVVEQRSSGAGEQTPSPR
jgi:ribosome-associated protein